MTPRMTTASERNTGHVTGCAGEGHPAYRHRVKDELERLMAAELEFPSPHANAETRVRRGRMDTRESSRELQQANKL